MNPFTSRSAFLRLVFLLAIATTFTGLNPNTGNPLDDSSGTGDRADGITDEAFLTQDLWNDGQAEIAFYHVERTRNQYGEAESQEFPVGTYLVKHDFDPDAMSKASADANRRVSTFKSAFFYEFESGSYEYKRNWVVNSRQRDLRPVKASFTSFDWCSNIYREMAFAFNDRVRALMRSDDYGNAGSTFTYRATSYPIQAIPVLVRGLDFSDDRELAFSVVTHDGSFVGARARLTGSESFEIPDGPVRAERIEIIYDGPIRSMAGEESDRTEIYWRGTDEARLLLGMESGTGRYRMTLVEQLRSPYWDENLWPRLQRVSVRP